MIRRPPRSTLDRSSAASDVYKRQDIDNAKNEGIWNNDWDLSLELIKRNIKSKNLQIKPPQRKDIVRSFENFYFGESPNKDSEAWSGFIKNEELLVEKEFFTLLSANRISWGFVSGAESASAKFVLEKRLRLESPPLIAMGDAPDKPCLLYTSPSPRD